MVELSMRKVEQELPFSSEATRSFSKPIVFFKVHKNDKRRLFLALIILEGSAGKITYLFSYDRENQILVDKDPDQDLFNQRLVPHSTIEIRKGIDFYLFMQEERFFLYINTQDCRMRLYTMKDLMGDSIAFKTISSTFYKDDCDARYFYLAANDLDNRLYVYQISLDLKEIHLVDSFAGRNIPPHAVRKYRNSILLSHEFNESRYYSRCKDQELSSIEMGNILVKNRFQIQVKHPELSLFEQRERLFRTLQEKYAISCIPGAIILLDLLTKERHVYKTGGGSPAHFEIDPNENMVYVSSHNFFNRLDSISMFGPAVIDKFEYRNNQLVWRDSFQWEYGFRYASHRVFYHRGKPLICTFGQPNRLIFIDAHTMQLYYYDDIGRDELTDQVDVNLYVNARESGHSFVALEVSENGEYIFFLDEQFLYLYHVADRCIHQKIAYSPAGQTDWDAYVLCTLHVMYLQ